MLHVSPPKQDRRWIWIPLLLISVGLHLALLRFGLGRDESSSRVYGTSQVHFQIQRPPDRPKPKLDPESRPPRTEPKPLPRRTRPRVARPQPNQQPPAGPQPEQRAQPVFGVTGESLESGTSGVAVRQGNTLAKQMERRMVKPGWATTLPAAPPPAPPPSERRAQPVPLFKLTRTPAFKHKVAPVYPALARQRGVQGKVLLEVLIDAQGHVCKMRVLQSPDDSLSRAAMAALRRSSLTPGQVGQKPVPVKLTIPYRFVLDG